MSRENFRQQARNTPETNFEFLKWYVQAAPATSLFAPREGKGVRGIVKSVNFDIESRQAAADKAHTEIDRRYFQAKGAEKPDIR